MRKKKTQEHKTLCIVWPTEKKQGQLPGYLMLRWGYEQCQQQCTLWSHTTSKKWNNKAYSQVNSSSRGILNGSSPSGTAPILITLNCSSETDMWASTTITKDQTMPMAREWQQQSKQKASLNIQCRFWSPHWSHHLSRGWWPAYTENTSLPTRGKKNRSTHQWAGKRNSQKEAHTSPWINITHQVEGTRSKKKWFCSLWKWDHKHRKRNEMKEKCILDKEPM